MTRCPAFSSCTGLRRYTAWALSVLVACLLLATGAHAQGFTRQFPANIKRGVMTVTAPPEVQINGMAMRLSPGVRIRGPNNLLLMSGALIGQQFAVNYVLEQQGLVRDIWILTQAEVDKLPKGWDTTTNFVFESDADKPKVDDGKTPFNQLPKFPKQ
ncbi:MAG: hypothetical protein ABJA49_04210 [Betaproteobacteria bacterium]